MLAIWTGCSSSDPSGAVDAASGYGPTAIGGAAQTSSASTGSTGLASGGIATGGTATGGYASGGIATGGKTTGGMATGGMTTGGAATGGKAIGGGRTGGASGTPTGGSIAAGGGSAGGSTSTGSDGCTDTLALGLSMSELAVFQTGKITIMKSGSGVTATTTNGGEVIEGRPTLFRVYVTTDSGFSARQLSARLSLNGVTYHAKQTITGSSAELNTGNSFQISVPASAMTASPSYSVQIVECATGSGTAHGPRFPATGTASLSTRTTGEIKLTLVPIQTNGVTPDLSALQPALKARIEAEYPTTEAQITINSTPITTCTITPSTAADSTAWSDCLEIVRARRTADAPARDVYYLGILLPAATYRDYCGRACIGGVGYVASSATSGSSKALVAVGFVPNALDTITHELGHNHGLEHSPGCDADSADTAFPYITNGTAYIGWVGWDNESPSTFLDPTKYTDLMAYCDPVWVSDYVYGKLATRIAAVSALTMLRGDMPSTWRVLNVIQGRASWGAPLTDLAFGQAESGAILDAAGMPLEEITVYRTAISGGLGAMYLVPEPSVNWVRLRVGSTSIAF